MKNRRLWLGATWLALLAVLGIAQAGLQKTAAAQGASKPQAPMFEVDPLWPKPLPNHWLLGSTIGVWADEQDHIWIIHRSSATLDNNERGAELKPPTYECCVGAPPILEFDPEGNLVHHWGGPGQGYEWPDSNHGIFVDHMGNVWIAGNGGPDGHLLRHIAASYDLFWDPEGIEKPDEVHVGTKAAGMDAARDLERVETVPQERFLGIAAAVPPEVRSRLCASSPPRGRESNLFRASLCTKA